MDEELQDMPPTVVEEPGTAGIPEDEIALVQKIVSEIENDCKKHDPAFKRMREDMQLATHGADKDWAKGGNYIGNIIGRHVKQKTAALYAKNPKIVARRRETLDFAIWDENPDGLLMAQQTIQQAQMMQMAAPAAIDPLTGQPVQAPMDPQMMQAVQQATELMADVQQGMHRRQTLTKLGKTLEILFAHSMRDQKPLDFKMGMKKLVRRTCTTGVGYVKLAFAREYGPQPVIEDRLSDVRSRIAHLERLAAEAQEGEIDVISAEMAELNASAAALQQEELVVVKEGLVFDYPQSTRVIPDRNCYSLVGFLGARHLTLEYLYTPDEVKEMFPDVNLDRGYTPYSATWVAEGGEDDGSPARRRKGKTEDGLVRVFEYFDKPSGLVYYVADGYPGLLRPAAPPDVFVEDYWPVYALTFNEVENEDELFPPSDARLMLHQQREINRSRQGQREHREAARPRFASAKGTLDEDDKRRLGTAKPFDVVELNMSPDGKIGDMLQPIPIPGVDPNLYATEVIFQDMQLVVGSQQATLGGIAKATATESAIAANSMAASDGSSVDDLDNFLTMVAKAAGQILLREMSPERVMEVVGPGAFWPPMTLDQIADQIFLEIEAGSSGKPNAATEIQNLQQLLPFLLQMPGIQPMWLAKEVLRRMDDRLDLTEAIAAGIPSIAMQNQMAQPNMVSPGGPQDNPDAQGAAGPEGASNVPAGPAEEQAGSDPAFGSNQV